ncbi:hypothetical protein DPMN_139815 [Dreissena polymorpha]|uniref:Uncharacterized protein n=1 Tax=Dreissena polymorpha TaxID=45954 RepID=A0A9D4G6F7_DREPO|nr:hypothetical protein DPMN_139815 [Dreissena polymorpha]
METHQPDIGQAPVPSPDISHNRDGVAHRNETKTPFLLKVMLCVAVPESGQLKASIVPILASV